MKGGRGGGSRGTAEGDYHEVGLPGPGRAPAPARPTPTSSALEEYLRAVFDRVDEDGTGTISIAEAVRALGDDAEFADIIGADSSDNILQAVRLMDGGGDRIDLGRVQECDARRTDGGRRASSEEVGH